MFNDSEKEKLFLDIEGPRLQALRHIYAPERIENGIRVGMSINIYHCNCMTIQYDGVYTLNFYKNGRPKYNKTTKLFDPPQKTLIHTEKFSTIEEIKSHLYKVLEERYNA